MERKRHWIDDEPDEYTEVAFPNQSDANGHRQLAIGAYTVVIGFLFALLGAFIFRPILIFSALVTAGGGIVWIIGFVIRLVHNNRNDPIPFTPGEIVGIIGAMLAVFGAILGLIGFTSDRAPIFAILLLFGGLMTSVIGLVLHFAVPRKR